MSRIVWYYDPMNYKELAEELAKSYETFIKAQIYMEIMDNSIPEKIKDKMVEEANRIYYKSDYSPTQLGLACYYGWFNDEDFYNETKEESVDIKKVIQEGLDYLDMAVVEW